MFYKINNEQRWHGPGQVIGRDGKQVLVKHGGTFVRVHSTRLSKIPVKVDLDTPKDTVGTSASGSMGLHSGEREY